MKIRVTGRPVRALAIRDGVLVVKGVEKQKTFAGHHQVWPGEYSATLEPGPIRNRADWLLIDNPPVPDGVRLGLPLEDWRAIPWVEIDGVAGIEASAKAPIEDDTDDAWGF